MQAADQFCELVRRNRTEEARRFLARAGEAVARVPKVRRALASLAYGEGDVDRAVGIYRDLLETSGHPGDAEALGWLLLQAGRHEEARQAYREWTRRWPGEHRFWAAYADSLEALGERDAARDALRRAVELEPAAGRAWYALTRLGDYEWIHERRAPLLDGGGATGDPGSDYSREFAAARYLESRGEWREAFDRLVRANEMRRRGGGMDTRRMIAAARALMRDWRAQDWRSAAPGHDSGAPIFIVGMPRSGTTLVEQILDSHPDVTAIGERPFLQREIATTLGGAAGPMARIDWAGAGERYLRRAREHAGEADRFTDKTIMNFNTVGFIHRMFPKARVVHCRRDPLDTCVSCLRTRFDDPNLSFGLSELGWFYGYYEGFMDFWGEEVGDAITELRYEDLVREPRERIAALLAALDLPWSEECLRFHDNARVARTASIHQVSRPIYTGAVGRAAPYRERLGPLEEAMGQAREAMHPSGAA